MATAGALQRVLRIPASQTPRAWELIASLHGDGQQRERVVRVECERVGGADDWGRYWAWGFAGVPYAHLTQGGAGDGGGSFAEWGELYPWLGTGSLKFTWGSHPGIARTIYCDLRSGEYNIPPCEFLEVHAAAWDPFAVGEVSEAGEWRVSGEIAAGIAHESTPITVTALLYGEPSTYRAVCPRPPGAYAFEVGGNEPAGVRAYGGLHPVVRNYETGLWQPPTTPIPLIERHVVIERISGTTPIDDGGGEEYANPWPAWIQWWVR